MEIPAEVGISPTLSIRGMIATRFIASGENIEQCPLILVKMSDEPSIDKTILGKYYFEWNKEFIAIVLGYGSLINHSYTPNVKYIHDFKKKLLTFRAIKDIQAGEELFVNYNWNPDDTAPVPGVLVDYNQEIVT